MNWIKKHQLYCDIHYAIETCITGLSSKQEPDYIAALVTRLPSKLSNILGRQYNVGGCFIHQKPCAKFCNPALQHYKSPEIGDLLIVYKENSPKGELYNALLLQAKKTGNIYNTTISAGDTHQLILYTRWPRFQYCRAGYLNGQERSINPKTITTGAQYLLIDENKFYNTPCGHHTFWCAYADEHLTASKSLALQIINLLEFQTGRPFVSKRLHMDHWSQMIWDLLQISANSYFNRRHAGFNNTPRGSEIMDFFTEICNQDSNQDSNQDLNQVLNQDKENYGISTLLIVRNSQEQE